MKRLPFLFLILFSATLACNLESALAPIPTAILAIPPTFIVLPTLMLLALTPQATIVLTSAVPGACTYPNGWQAYIVQTGDTLSSLAVRTNTTLATVVSSNCLASPDSIQAGQTLYLPIAPSTSSASDPQCMPQNSSPSGVLPVVTSLAVQPGTRVVGTTNEIRYQINTSTVNIVASGLQNITELRICWAAIGAGGDPLHFLGNATISGTQARLPWTVPAGFKSITFWPLAVNAAKQTVLGPGITVVGQ